MTQNVNIIIIHFCTLQSVGVASAVSNRGAVLPVVSVDILAANGNKRVNVLLDSGTQISLIRLSLAEEMNLKGKDVTVIIGKVGGEEEQLKTKLFRVRVRSLEGNSVYTVMAVGIPCISEDISEIKLRDVAKRLGLSKASFIVVVVQLIYWLELIILFYTLEKRRKCKIL